MPSPCLATLRRRLQCKGPRPGRLAVDSFIGSAWPWPTGLSPAPALAAYPPAPSPAATSLARDARGCDAVIHGRAPDLRRSRPGIKATPAACAGSHRCELTRSARGQQSPSPPYAPLSPLPPLPPPPLLLSPLRPPPSRHATWASHGAVPPSRASHRPLPRASHRPMPRLRWRPPRGHVRNRRRGPGLPSTPSYRTYIALPRVAVLGRIARHWLWALNLTSMSRCHGALERRRRLFPAETGSVKPVLRRCVVPAMLQA